MPNCDADGPTVNEATDPPPEPGPALVVAGLERRHAPGTGIGPVDLVVPEAGLLSVTGPSGCGKSTLLRVIAGLEPADAGTIVIAGRNVERSLPGRRSVGLVEQHLPLYDHLDVTENVEMAVSGLRIDREERRRRVAAALEIAEIGSFASRRAAMLSGGERARTCLARLLARRPAVALLDEPFAGLDRDLRDRVRRDTLDSLASAGVATVLVSHDDRDLDPHGRILEIDSGGRPVC